MAKARTSHDRLFKELLSNFFIDFLDLFLPDVLAYIDPDSLVALDKEMFADLKLGAANEVDLLMQAQFKGQTAYFIIHTEHQSYRQTPFPRRMFRYFARLSEKHNLPVYPIVVLSYDKPYKAAPNSYEVVFPNKTVLQFSYDVIQLNQLDWRTFVNRPNPIASALMAKMRIKSEDRVKVKLACLRMLAGLKLNPAQVRLISGFTDIYLHLNPTEDQAFQEQLTGLANPKEKEAVMEIVTSWMEKGIETGRKQGKTTMLLGQLTMRFGNLESAIEDRIQHLSDTELDSLSLAFLGFSGLSDLISWLSQHETAIRK